ncbi:ABC transporter ATP-binding protein [Ornithinimicrobium sufpigmenti]|uniref:ABC transporter ATP-binding protein n=1 Tax=Ornithinimicrobium sufpigmenti TaxID=2508882 RepID=UPI0010363C1C|nr:MULTISPECIES: ATP-binding cassette domain-containing protein [unclassified Ornithinimicrobium]
MSRLEAQLAVDLGDFHLDLDLRCDRGVTAVLGPNGSGKTTALKAVAGLHTLTSGQVRVDGQTWADHGARLHLPPEARSVGMLLADPLLFPHLSLLDNVAYGPRSRGMPRRAARERAAAELGRVGLAELADRRPAQVSQGQAQRAALARALATDPAVLLLDEPLSALDPQTRSATRAELSHRLREFDGVTVLVTHDALDALTLGDRLVFVEEGREVQSGTPAEVISRPRSPYVAGVVGLNLLRGTLVHETPVHETLVHETLVHERCDTSVAATTDVSHRSGTGLASEGQAPANIIDLGDGAHLVLAEVPEDVRHGEAVWATVAPEAVALFTRRPQTSARNVWPLTVAAVTVTGPRARIHLTGAVHLVAEVTLGAVAELELIAGREVWASVKATEVTAYPA